MFELDIIVLSVIDDANQIIGGYQTVGDTGRFFR